MGKDSKPEVSKQPEVELLGRTREEGVFIVTPLGDNEKYTEVKFNDGTVRRDYK